MPGIYDLIVSYEKLGIRTFKHNKMNKIATKVIGMNLKSGREYYGHDIVKYGKKVMVVKSRRGQESYKIKARNFHSFA